MNLGSLALNNDRQRFLGRFTQQRLLSITHLSRALLRSGTDSIPLRHASERLALYWRVRPAARGAHSRHRPLVHPSTRRTRALRPYAKDTERRTDGF